MYDRWGKRVFHSDSPDYKWDGKVGGSVAKGSYRYRLLIPLDDQGAPPCQFHGSLIVL
ncbi:MAG: gliding motility-associated C-terminal domain-containing protein [Bacteroidales bacterium]|nr:gliding motility-associated C-terminal domain-containing protein [Bacteroidales bacterium]